MAAPFRVVLDERTEMLARTANVVQAVKDAAKEMPAGAPSSHHTHQLAEMGDVAAELGRDLGTHGSRGRRRPMRGLLDHFVR